MSDIAIKVEHLSKQYHIGHLQQRHDTLRDAIMDGFHRLRINSSSRTKDEDTIWALSDISFQVTPGEVVGIIGRNGAGKTTLLKILSQITEPTSGRAMIDGRLGSLLEVGTGFHPELTGRENIYLNGAILGMKRKEIDRKFEEIVAFSEIEKFLDTPVKRYSSGMYVRLAFAVAAHLEPEILLVDEVLAVGDAQFQKKCLGKMGAEAKEGRTVLFVSHNLIALSSLCSRAIWLDQGEMRGEGPSADIITKYLQLQSTKVSEKVWDNLASAPGDETARIHRVWVESEKALFNGGFAREAEITIGVEYWHFKPSSQVHVTLQVSVAPQIIAFATSSANDPAWQRIPQHKGLLRSVCKIPANFLNTGQHQIRVLIVKDRRQAICVLEDALSFDIVETDQRTGAWFGRVAGVVRPNLVWKTEFIDTQ